MPAAASALLRQPDTRNLPRLSDSLLPETALPDEGTLLHRGAVAADHELGLFVRTHPPTLKRLFAHATAEAQQGWAGALAVSNSAWPASAIPAAHAARPHAALCEYSYVDVRRCKCICAHLHGAAVQALQLQQSL